jgi:acyl-CoA reductase-like NAD-dependent aldehyde dehydrogenase
VFSNKTRNTIMAIVASFSVAGVAAATAAAQPRETPWDHCVRVHNEYDGYMEAARAAFEKGEEEAAARLLQEAGDIKAQAKGFGCKWAGGESYRVAPPKASPETPATAPESSLTSPSSSAKPSGPPLTVH